MPPRTTSVNYGARCQLPEILTNAAGHETHVEFSYDFGNPTEIRDPNGITEFLQYDDFGRLSREDHPDGTATIWTYTRCAVPPCWGAADLRLRITKDWRDISGVSVNTRQVHYDGLHRPRTDETNRVLGIWTKNVVNYDAFGRLAKRYQPYSVATNGHSEWTYDGIGRVLTAKLFQSGGALDRTTNYSYAGRTITIVDPLGRTTQQILDVTDRLRRVIDPAPGGTTSYDYDALGNLNRVTDPINAISSGSYNLRGFKTQWTDADRGTWTFVPNSLNELVSWTNAKSQTFSATYDPLGRITSRAEPEGVSNWTWGALAVENNIGSLKSKSGLGYLEELLYDGAGRLSSRKVTTDQNEYTYDYAYNAIGAIDTVSYPTSPIPADESGSRFKIKYLYSFGAPFQIQDVTNSPETLWTLTSANDYGSATAETLSNGVIAVASTYKPWTNELTSMSSGVSGSTINRQNLSFQWDTVGNLNQRHDLIQGLTEIFTPDALNRVTTSSLNGNQNLSLQYDASGNIVSKFPAPGSYTYGSPSHPHGVTAAGTTNFSYDSNGNVTSRGGLAQTWASFDLPTVLQATVNGSTWQSQFFYGPDHQRWKQVATYQNGVETTHYVGGLLEKMFATSTAPTYWRHYVHTPSGLTVVISRNSDLSKSVRYLLSDHLGSSDAVLDQAGAVVIRQSFAPFGARRGSNWSDATPPDWPAIGNTTRHGFTFQEHLDNIGLIHMNGRVYDPTAGRFLSVDPIIGNIGDSQSVNPYAYVGNRPLSWVDPTGMTADPASCAVLCESILRTIGGWFASMLGMGRPLPPPVTAIPTSSAQNGVYMCDAGMRSTMCAGVPVLSLHQLPGGMPGGDSGAVPAPPAQTANYSDAPFRVQIDGNWYLVRERRFEPHASTITAAHLLFELDCNPPGQVLPEACDGQSGLTSDPLSPFLIWPLRLAGAATQGGLAARTAGLGGHAGAAAVGVPYQLIGGTRGLAHSFDSHASQWFGRQVSASTHLAQWQGLVEQAAASRLQVSWSVGGNPTVGHLARIDGKYFFAQFYVGGPRAGELATAFVPNQRQLSAILQALGR